MPKNIQTQVKPNYLTSIWVKGESWVSEYLYLVSVTLNIRLKVTPLSVHGEINYLWLTDLLDLRSLRIKQIPTFRQCEGREDV